MKLCTSREVQFLIFATIWIDSQIQVYGTDKHNEKLPAIVWWSDFLYPHTSTPSKIKCLKGSCIAMAEKSYRGKQSDVAFIFYGTGFSIEKLPFPRKSNHVWALLHEESPMNNYIFSHSVGMQLFNYTATFSRASDFPLTTQFLPSLEYLTQRQPVPLIEKNTYRKRGAAPILYIQSHCNVASDRDLYVKELMKFIQVDSYGQCLNNKEIPPEFASTETHQDVQFLEFISMYKFHIAFENAICDDYITEKLYRSLHVGSVPIYMGSDSVKDWTPSDKSVILTTDFESPSELGAFIKKLDKDDNLYAEYLMFKKRGVTNSFLINAINKRSWGVNDPDKIDFIRAYECYICDELTKLVTSGILSEPKIANRKHMNCFQPHRSLNDIEYDNLRDDWWKEDWIEQYWFAYDQGKALELMLKKNETNSANFYEYLVKVKYNQ